MIYRKKEAGIRLKGKNEWCVVARVRVNGKIIQRRHTFTGTKERARELLAEMKREIREGGGAECSLTSPQVFDELLTNYREKRNKVLSQDISRIDRLSADLGKVQLNAFPDRFESYMRLFKNTPMVKYAKTDKKGRLPSNATANRIIECVRAAFNLALALKLIKENPITKARFPKGKESPRDRYLNEEERARLLNVIEARRPYLLPFVRYSLLVPTRKSELTGLTREAYNAFTNTVYVPKSKAGIPIHKPVPEEMKDYFQGVPAGCPWLFYRQDKEGAFHPLGDCKKAFQSCVKAAGLQNVRIHDLRHVAASDLVMAGNSERAIMDIAGWKTPMLSTYWHKDSLRSAQNIKFSPKCEASVKRQNLEAV
jgi:integrase